MNLVSVSRVLAVPFTALAVAVPVPAGALEPDPNRFLRLPAGEGACRAPAGGVRHRLRRSAGGPDVYGATTRTTSSARAAATRGASAPAAIAANLDRILGEIRRVAPDAPVVLIGPADPDIGPAAEVSRPLYRALDAAMARVAAERRVGYAALLPNFNPDGDGGAALCTLTLACSEGDDAGYRAIADAVEVALAARPGRR